MTKLFILGATGYIGGDALYAVAHAHPEYEITALVRNSEKGAQVVSQYPKIKLVYGDSNSSTLIEDETKKADVVLHFASSADDEVGTTAITNGLAARDSKTPIYYIHTSGTGILTYGDIDRFTYGELSLKVFDDWDGVAELTSLPDHAPHRNVDKLVLNAGNLDPALVKTAIVCPPCIYGPGRGPGNTVSMQIPGLAALTLRQGHGVQVGEGETHWSSVHVQDLSDVYLKLVEAAAAGGGDASWGAQGYYFAEAGDIVWGEVGQLVAQIAHKHGFIDSEKVVNHSADEVDAMHAHGSMLWGASSRSKAIRAGKVLGWVPTRPALEETVEDSLLIEAKRLELVPGHAKVAAGDA